MSRIADLLRGATITRIRFNAKGGWVDVPAGWTDDVAAGTSAGYYLPYTRQQILERAAERAPLHPVLSWQVNGTLVAHRRAGEEMSACGRAGELTVVVDAGIPPCPKCFPA